MPIRHVLVVDDSKSARLMLRKILQNLGMTVDTADSAEEALEWIAARARTDRGTSRMRQRSGVPLKVTSW